VGTFGYFSLTYNLMRGTVTVESNGSDVEPQPAQTQNPVSGTSPQGYQTIKFKVSQDTPASRAAGTNSMYNDIYLDLASHRYFQSVYDGSGADLYFNGTYYKVSKLAEMDQCYVSSANEDFPTNLNRDEILDIGAFLLVETLKSKAGSDSGEFVNNYLKNVGPDEYALTGVNQFQNSVFRKYGDTYLGSNVTYKYGSLVYNYVYSDIQPVSSGDFDAALSQEISKWNNCKDVSGGPNPLP
jgi:hypothetical protein